MRLEIFAQKKNQRTEPFIWIAVMRHRTVVLQLVIPALLIFAKAAGAHAILLSAVPDGRQVVRGTEASIELRFNARIDAKRSRLTLVAPNGARSALALLDQPSPDALRSQARGLTTGSWALEWQVLANDGHISRGSIPFRVQ